MTHLSFALCFSLLQQGMPTAYSQCASPIFIGKILSSFRNKEWKFLSTYRKERNKEEKKHMKSKISEH